MQKLDGQIERVVFRNEENGFCVLRVKMRGHKDLVAMTVNVAQDNAASGQ